MTYYTVYHKDGSKNTHLSDSKDQLIKELFQGDKTRFKQDVQYLQWTTAGMTIKENVRTGGLERAIVGADVNPYGWRG